MQLSQDVKNGKVGNSAFLAKTPGQPPLKGLNDEILNSDPGVLSKLGLLNKIGGISSLA